MKDFFPEGDAVLCEPIDDFSDNSGFIYEDSNKLPLYKVLKTGSNNLEPKIVSGDVIICNSIGNAFISDGKKYNIFSYKNIIGKIES